MIGRTIYNYRIEELIGEGGMGTVYRAVDTVLGREVALKMLHPNLINQATFFDRFRNEAQILARLNHPNIATLHNFIEDEGDYFMVMEFIEGADLERVLKTNGKLPVETVLQITEQTLEGLSHAHVRGVFHRDLKPANLIVTPEKQLKIMDFGIAKAVDSQKLTQVNKLIGTLEYIAPEILKGDAPSVQSDLYAVGVVMYELLTGRMPFAANTDYDLMQQIIHKKPLQINAEEVNIPKTLADIINKLLQKNPAKRYANANELKRAVSEVSSIVPSGSVNPLARLSLPSVSMPKVTVPKFTVSQFQWKDVNKTWLILATSLIVAIGILTFYKPTPQPNVSSSEVLDQPRETPPQEEVKSDKYGSEIPPNKLLANLPDDRIRMNEPSDEKGVKRNKKEEEKDNNRRGGESGNRDKKDSPAEIERKQEQAVKENRANEPQQKQAPPPKPGQEEVKETISDSKPASVPVSITLSGQQIVVALQGTVNSDKANEKDPLIFSVSKPLLLKGKTVFAAGAKARGYVSDVRKRSALRKETLEIRITDVQATNGQWVPVKAAVFRQVASSSNASVVFGSGQQFIAETTYTTLLIN